MTLHPRAVWHWSRTPLGRTATRYTMVSIVSTVVAQVVLLITFGVAHLWSAAWCNVFATTVATFPSYYLNRAWVWGKSGRSHLLREVVPFWVLAFIGLGLSTGAVALADHVTQTDSHLVRTVIVNLSSLAAYGLIWVGKFLIFHNWMFGPHHGARPLGATPATGAPQPPRVVLEAGAAAEVVEATADI